MLSLELVEGESESEDRTARQRSRQMGKVQYQLVSPDWLHLPSLNTRTLQTVQRKETWKMGYEIAML